VRAASATTRTRPADRAARLGELTLDGPPRPDDPVPGVLFQLPVLGALAAEPLTHGTVSLVTLIREHLVSRRRGDGDARK
jgi:hypothetical protein